MRGDIVIRIPLEMLLPGLLIIAGGLILTGIALVALRRNGWL